MSVFKLEGIEELNRAVNGLISGLAPGNVEPLLMSAADIVTQEAQRNIDRQFNVVTGRLAGSPVTKQLSSRDQHTPATAIAAIDRSHAAGAPHAHFLERGTSRMRARPFFRPAVDAKRYAVVDAVATGVARLVQEAVR